MKQQDKVHPLARLREIKRLRLLLKTGRFTQSELMSIRGKIGGLTGGTDTDSRRRGGLASAKKRWGFDFQEKTRSAAIKRGAKL